MSEIKAMRQRGEDEMNADAPEAESLGAEFWNSTRVVAPGETSRVPVQPDDLAEM